MQACLRIRGCVIPPVHILGFALKGQTTGSSQVSESKSLLLEKQSLWMGWGGHQSPSGKQRRARTRAVLSPELALLRRAAPFSSLALHCFTCLDHKLSFAATESSPFCLWLYKPGLSAQRLQVEARIYQMNTWLWGSGWDSLAGGQVLRTQMSPGLGPAAALSLEFVILKGPVGLVED